jgi:ubiquinone/menaquinone biosynthesis C-methylase UbiE
MIVSSYNGKSAYVGDVATEYDNLRVSEISWHHEHRILEGFLGECLGGKTSGKVLDLPVGTGRFFSIYDSMKLDVVGIDISDEMISVAKKKITSGREGHIQLKTGDVTNISLADKAVDVAISFRLTHLLPPEIYKKGMKELCRVSSQGVILHGFNMITGDTLFLRAKRMLKSILAANSKAKGEGDFSHIQTFFHTEKSLVELFRKEGFELHSSVTMDESEKRDSWLTRPSRVYYFRRIHA